MRQEIAIALLAVSTALSGCQGPRHEERPAVAAEVTVEPEAEPIWRLAVTAEDLARLDRLDAVWQEALGKAAKAGYRRQIAREGAILDPDAALARPAPTPGTYNCRIMRFGAERRRDPFFRAYPPFYCHVGVVGDRLTFTKQTGSDRPSGFLWEDDDRKRLIFLGTMAQGEEVEAYGENPAVDRAGIIERVGPLRFRLLILETGPGHLLDVYELVPAVNQAS